MFVGFGKGTKVWLFGCSFPEVFEREMGFKAMLEILQRTGKAAGFRVATLDERCFQGSVTVRLKIRPFLLQLFGRLG